tara:strand:- start:320 stop:658 length:339 start_codon:yes stop_codon:yes gene_type:complete
MGLQQFLIIGAILFFIGLFGSFTKRNTIVVLMCVELMFNAVNLTAVAMSRYVVPYNSNHGVLIPETILTGHIFSIFIITIAAAEIAIGLAIVIALVRNYKSVFISDAKELKH